MRQAGASCGTHGGSPVSMKTVAMGVVVGIASLWLYDRFVRGRI